MQGGREEISILFISEPLPRTRLILHVLAEIKKKKKMEGRVKGGETRKAWEGRKNESYLAGVYLLKVIRPIATHNATLRYKCAIGDADRGDITLQI